MINFKVFSLLESILELDNQLIEVLQYMRGRGDYIATKILPLIRKDINTHVNYLRPSTQDDMFFIPDSQVAKTKEKGEEFLWQGKNTAKVGRTWRQVLKDNNIPFDDSQIETFVNNYKNAYKKLILKEPIDTFLVVSGEEIRDWYLEDNYIKGGGSLNNSCMQYRKCQKYLDIYVQNPEVCQLLILVEGDKLLGRALIWKLKTGQYYLDRVYVRWDSDEERMVEYFEENFNSQKSYSTGSYTDDPVVKIKREDFEYYPYMDTFAFLDYLTYELFTKNDDQSVYYELLSTSGDYENTGVYSEYEDRYIPRSLAYNLSDYGWVSEENIETSKFDGRPFLESDAVESIYGLINKKEAVEIEPENWIPKIDLYYIRVGDEWRPIPLKWFLKNQTDEIPDKAVKKTLLDGRRILVNSDDIIRGIFGDKDLYIDDFNPENKIVFYQVDTFNTDDSIEWRNHDGFKIGLINGIPILFGSNNQYMIDQYLEDKLKYSNGKIVAYCKDISVYLSEIYSTFDPFIDKVDLTPYNLNESNIGYISEYNPLIFLYLKRGDQWLDFFFQPLDSSLERLNTINFNFQKFEIENIHFFNKKRNEGFNNSEIIKSIILSNIFDDVISGAYLNNFSDNNKLSIDIFNDYPFIPNIEYKIGSHWRRFLYQMSNEVTFDNTLLDEILEYALVGIKKFCVANNL